MPTARSLSYRQHHPEETPLFSLVKEHLPSFLKASEHTYKSGLPKYVQGEFDAYAKCGIHAHGFARARCQSCGRMLLVAFSCKKRGICPSCNARRMADTAARLVDRVLPDVRLRQWVLSVPFELRLLLAKKPEYAEQHIKPWSDAPNIALLNNLHPSATAQQEGTSQEVDGMPPMTAPLQNERDHRDEIPSVDSYFQDEVPPD